MKSYNNKAFTFVEMMVTMAVVALTGTGVFMVLRTGMILFAKNSAINFTHQQVRYGLVELEQDLHTAISTPQLVTTTGTIVSGTGPAAGVSFRQYAAGPFAVSVGTSATVSGSSTQISIVTGTSNVVPLAGQRIHIQALPTNLVEVDIANVSASSSSSAGTVYTLTLVGPLGTDIPVRSPIDNSTMSVACFLSTPVSYTVVNNQLIHNYLTSSGSASSVAANFVASPTPFSVSTINGATNPAYITVSGFTVNDPSSSNRNYKATNLTISIQTPHWSQLTTQY
jgi:prepilin-type N-terminal cleavage/methylation domain-containing protein